jgi:mannose-6-phosphate isomerase-like protein (cupin superfamily)
MADPEQIVCDVAEASVPDSGGMRRRVVFSGDQMMVAITHLDPGQGWTSTRHPEEELVYVVSGRLEYGDGRVVTAGMLTVNRSLQHHPGKAAGDGVTVLLEVYAPPVPALRPAAPAVCPRDASGKLR